MTDPIRSYLDAKRACDQAFATLNRVRSVVINAARMLQADLECLDRVSWNRSIAIYRWNDLAQCRRSPTRPRRVPQDVK